MNCNFYSVCRSESVKSRASTSTLSSGGCVSERSSGCIRPEEGHAFDSDFPMGTIKRKPSMMPKIPLTSTTRLLVKDSGITGESSDSAASGGQPDSALVRSSHRQSYHRKSLTEEVNTIRRKQNISISARVQLPPPELVSPSALESALDELDSLPLPPPPSFNSPDETSLVDPESLPPPPPEVYDNVLDDFPLPPPPPPMQLLIPLHPLRDPDSSIGGSLKPCLKLSGFLNPSGTSCASGIPPRVLPKPKKEDNPADVIYSGSRLRYN